MTVYLYADEDGEIRMFTEKLGEGEVSWQYLGMVMLALRSEVEAEVPE